MGSNPFARQGQLTEKIKKIDIRDFYIEETKFNGKSQETFQKYETYVSSINLQRTKIKTEIKQASKSHIRSGV